MNWDSAKPDSATRKSPDISGETTPLASREEQVLKLFLSHHARLVSYLRARVGSRQEAEDLAQQAYEEMLSVKKEGAASFVAAYLYRTATNLAINRLKQQARAREIEDQTSHEVPRETPSPEPLWVARERVRLVQSALTELPAKVRMVFMLRVYEELKYEEIIERLAVEHIKIDRWTAMRYVERALAHCQRVIAAADATRRGST